MSNLPFKISFGRKPVLVAVSLLVFLLLALSPLYQLGTQDSMAAMVTDKERVCEGGNSGECRWMVMTDRMVFINKDAFWHFKFDSTTDQSRLAVGETYQIDYYGWRIPFLSVYPNLTGARRVED